MSINSNEAIPLKPDEGGLMAFIPLHGGRDCFTAGSDKMKELTLLLHF